MNVIVLCTDVAAKENAGAIWFFGDGAGLDFRDEAPAALTESVAFSAEGSAVISDAEGNLLFYTDGIQVWDREHAPMPHGSGLHGSPFAPQSALIVPNPVHPDLYYLFTVSDGSGLQYAVVDMEANNGLGDVGRKNVRLWRSTAEKITAVRHNNGSDVWVIVTGLDNNSFYAYLVSKAGVNADPVISNAGVGHTRCEFDQSGFLKASPDGTKLALSVFDPGFFELFDFNASTGEVLRPILLGDYESAYGIEFSSDNTKLYATVVSWVHKHIYQFDLEAKSIPASAQAIGETSEETRFRALQLASDGKIYVARESSLYLGVIEFPNKPGTASQYVDKGIFLEGRQCRNGLPNFVQSFFTPPVIALTIRDTKIAEDDGAATFLVELSEASRSEISVMYSTEDGTAGAGSDYHKTAGILRIPEGDKSGTIHVNIVNDDEFDEGPETVIVRLSNPLRAVLRNDFAVGTILDNDLVELSIADAVADEGSGALVFTATLSQASRSEVLVEYATSDKTALAGDDYQAATGTLVMPAGERTGTIRVPLVDDDFDEDDTTVRLQLRNSLNADLLMTQAQGTIRDDDDPPQITIDDAVLDEQTGTMRFTARLSQISKRDVQVDYTTRNDTAVAGNDYTETSGTLMIPAGFRVRPILVDIADDDLHEDQERFLLTLTEPLHATLLDSEGVGMIQDNDDPPVLSIREMTADEGAGTMNFLATLSTVSGRDVSFQYALQDNTAIAGQDYAAISGIFTIPAGSQAAMLNVPVYDDVNDEQDEDFFVLMSQPQHAILADSRIVGTILDDDAPPSIGITDVAAGEDAESVDFTISLSGTSYQDISVHAATVDGTATIAGNDYVLRPDMEIVMPAGQTEYTFSVRINEDRRIEGEEYFFVQLHDPVNGSLLDGHGQATIYDNDALPEIGIGDGIVDENAGTVTFIVSLSEKSALPVIVNYAACVGTAMNTEKTASVQGTLAIVPQSLSGEIVVPYALDEFPEKPSNVCVLLSEPHNALLAASSDMESPWEQ